jgi:hypothetical protein
MKTQNPNHVSYLKSTTMLIVINKNTLPDDMWLVTKLQRLKKGSSSTFDSTTPAATVEAMLGCSRISKGNTGTVREKC